MVAFHSQGQGNQGARSQRVSEKISSWVQSLAQCVSGFGGTGIHGSDAATAEGAPAGPITPRADACAQILTMDEISRRYDRTENAVLVAAWCPGTTRAAASSAICPTVVYCNTAAADLLYQSVHETTARDGVSVLSAAADTLFEAFTEACEPAELESLAALLRQTACGVRTDASAAAIELRRYRVGAWVGGGAPIAAASARNNSSGISGARLLRWPARRALSAADASAPHDAPGGVRITALDPALILPGNNRSRSPAAGGNGAAATITATTERRSRSGFSCDDFGGGGGSNYNYGSTNAKGSAIAGCYGDCGGRRQQQRQRQGPWMRHWRGRRQQPYIVGSEGPSLSELRLGCRHNDPPAETPWPAVIVAFHARLKAPIPEAPSAPTSNPASCRKASAGLSSGGSGGIDAYGILRTAPSTNKFAAQPTGNVRAVTASASAAAAASGAVMVSIGSSIATTAAAAARTEADGGAEKGPQQQPQRRLQLQQQHRGGGSAAATMAMEAHQVPRMNLAAAAPGAVAARLPGSGSAAAAATLLLPGSTEVSADAYDNLWARRESLVLSALTQLVTAFTADCTAVLYQNGPSIAYFGMWSAHQPRAPYPPSPRSGGAGAVTDAAVFGGRIAAAAAAASGGGNDDGGDPPSGLLLLAQLFSLQLSKLERMLGDVMGEARIWKGIVQVPVSIQLPPPPSSPPSSQNPACTPCGHGGGGPAPVVRAAKAAMPVHGSYGSRTAKGPCGLSAAHPLEAAASAAFLSPLAMEPDRDAFGDRELPTEGEAEAEPPGVMELHQVTYSLGLNPLATSTWGLMLDMPEEHVRTPLDSALQKALLLKSRSQQNLDSLQDRSRGAGGSAGGAAAAGGMPGELPTPGGLELTAGGGGGGGDSSAARVSCRPVPFPAAAPAWEAPTGAGIRAALVATEARRIRSSNHMSFAALSKLQLQEQQRIQLSQQQEQQTVPRTVRQDVSGDDGPGDGGDGDTGDSSSGTLEVTAVRRAQSMLSLASVTILRPGGATLTRGSATSALPRQCAGRLDVTSAAMYGSVSSGQASRSMTRVLKFAGSLKNTPSALQQALAATSMSDAPSCRLFQRSGVNVGGGGGGGGVMPSAPSLAKAGYLLLDEADCTAAAAAAVGGSATERDGGVGGGDGDQVSGELLAAGRPPVQLQYLSSTEEEHLAELLVDARRGPPRLPSLPLPLRPLKPPQKVAGRSFVQGLQQLQPWSQQHKLTVELSSRKYGTATAATADGDGGCDSHSSRRLQCPSLGLPGSSPAARRDALGGGPSDAAPPSGAARAADAAHAIAAADVAPAPAAADAALGSAASPLSGTETSTTTSVSSTSSNSRIRPRSTAAFAAPTGATGSTVGVSASNCQDAAAATAAGSSGGATSGVKAVVRAHLLSSPHADATAVLESVGRGAAADALYGSKAGGVNAVVSLTPLAACPMEALRSRPLASEAAAPVAPAAAAAAACWHEVTAVRWTDPLTGQDIILVTQTDVSDKVQAEAHLAQVAEAEHRLLEAIFPRHVLTYMTTEGALLDSLPVVAATRAGGDGDGGDSGSGGGDGGDSGGGGGVYDGHRLPVVRDINKLATSHAEVTLLFADIQGFTPMCQTLEPQVVMAFLNDLFTRFDSRLEEFGVYKVETIGDCYFVAGGLIDMDEHGMPVVRTEDSSADPQHAEKVLLFAKAMLAAASRVSLPTTGSPVRMRIGIHSGPVVSGIVGQRMPRFCLFGDTVNTASRMESTGVPGCIHVSEATKRLMPGENFLPTGGIEVKGKGLMNTYLWAPPDHELYGASPPDSGRCGGVAASAAGAATARRFLSTEQLPAAAAAAVAVRAAGRAGGSAAAGGAGGGDLDVKVDVADAIRQGKREKVCRDWLWRCCPLISDM